MEDLRKGEVRHPFGVGGLGAVARKIDQRKILARHTAPAADTKRYST